MKLWKIIATMAGAVFLASAAGCGALGDDDPIRIGVLYTTTGTGQVYGAPALLGHQIMVDRINAEGGLLGRRVETVHRDDRSEPGFATSQARELVTRYGVDFLIGGVTSAVGQAISEVARQERVIYIAPMSKTIELTDAENFHPYVFRTAANTNTEAKSAAIIADRLGLNRICTILLDYSYGHSLDEAFRDHLRQLRPQAQIAYQAWPTLGANDYTTYITNMLNAGCDGVFSSLWGSHFPSFAKQAQTVGFFERVKYISAGEIGSPEIAEEMGDDMPTGIWGNSYELFYYPDSPEHAAYVREVSERIGKESTPSFPITGYIAMQFLAEAIRQAGTTDVDAVRDALRGLTIMTPIGEQTIRPEDHQANRGQFWGEVNPSNRPGYPFKMLNPVEYIPADGIMD
jgi:branched-chain amino acid transport system substrate-binding protein